MQNLPDTFDKFIAFEVIEVFAEFGRCGSARNHCSNHGCFPTIANISDKLGFSKLLLG